MELKEIVRTLNECEFLGVSDWKPGYDESFVEAPGASWRFPDFCAKKIASWLVARPIAEPTLDECLAAINRNEHRGVSTWEIRVMSTVSYLNELEIRLIGKHYIDREREAAAKA